MLDCLSLLSQLRMKTLYFLLNFLHLLQRLHAFECTFPEALVLLSDFVVVALELADACFGCANGPDGVCGSVVRVTPSCGPSCVTPPGPSLVFCVGEAESYSRQGQALADDDLVDEILSLMLQIVDLSFEVLHGLCLVGKQPLILVGSGKEVFVSHAL